MFKRIKYRRLLFIFVIAVSFYSCQSRKVSFSVAIPKGWLVIDSVDEAQERLLKMYPPPETSEPAFGDNIGIGIIHFERQREYMERLLDRLKHEVNFYKETGRGVTRVNSFEADWAQYLIQINPQSDTIEQKAYYIGSEKCVFQIICSTKPNEMGNIGKELDSVLGSFKVIH